MLKCKRFTKLLQDGRLCKPWTAQNHCSCKGMWPLAMFDCSHCQCPKYFVDVYTPVHNIAARLWLRSADHGDIVIPRAWSTQFGCRSFRMCKPTIWNKLPQDLQSTDTREQFEHRLKGSLFECAYGRRHVWQLLTEGAQYKWTYLLTYLKCIQFTKLLQGGQLGELSTAWDRCRPQWQGGVATCNGKQKIVWQHSSVFVSSRSRCRWLDLQNLTVGLSYLSTDMSLVICSRRSD